jgi:hypothetical protein
VKPSKEELTKNSVPIFAVTVIITEATATPTIL